LEMNLHKMAEGTENHLDVFLFHARAVRAAKPVDVPDDRLMLLVNLVNAREHFLPVPTDEIQPAVRGRLRATGRCVIRLFVIHKGNNLLNTHYYDNRANRVSTQTTGGPAFFGQATSQAGVATARRHPVLNLEV
jgi:hypothetical protein